MSCPPLSDLVDRGDQPFAPVQRLVPFAAQLDEGFGVPALNVGVPVEILSVLLGVESHALPGGQAGVAAPGGPAADGLVERVDPRPGALAFQRGPGVLGLGRGEDAGIADVEFSILLDGQSEPNWSLSVGLRGRSFSPRYRARISSMVRRALAAFCWTSAGACRGRPFARSPGWRRPRRMSPARPPWGGRGVRTAERTTSSGSLMISSAFASALTRVLASASLGAPDIGGADREGVVHVHDEAAALLGRRPRRAGAGPEDQDHERLFHHRAADRLTRPRGAGRSGGSKPSAGRSSPAVGFIGTRFSNT